VSALAFAAHPRGSLMAEIVNMALEIFGPEWFPTGEKFSFSLIPLSKAATYQY
jgi:hypothetical protein